MYDIRNISLYFPRAHSRYYVDSNGVFYTSISPNTDRVTIDGKRHNVSNMRKTIAPTLNKTTKQIERLPIPGNKKYFIMYDGTILQRLKTKQGHTGRIEVCLILLDGSSSGTYVSAHRLIAACFLGPIEGKEVHHKDGNFLNNSIDNLEILTFEEHRGKGGIHSKEQNL